MYRSTTANAEVSGPIQDNKKKKRVPVASVLSSIPLNISFRRGLGGGARLKEWLILVSSVLPVSLNNDKDKFIWQLGKNGVFSTQALYREMMKSEKNFGKVLFWKARLL
jgi:hypothetical protein